MHSFLDFDLVWVGIRLNMGQQCDPVMTEANCIVVHATVQWLMMSDFHVMSVLFLRKKGWRPF